IDGRYRDTWMEGRAPASPWRRGVAELRPPNLDAHHGHAGKNAKTDRRALQRQSRLLQTEAPVAGGAVYGQLPRARRRPRGDHRLPEPDFSKTGQRGIFQLRKNFEPSRKVRAGLRPVPRQERGDVEQADVYEIQ